ncbi:MAG: hypothetical protein QXH03_02710 [Candidatus Bathyarchaeia archaeon]
MEKQVYVWVARVSKLGKSKAGKSRFYVLVPDVYGEALYGLKVKVTVEVLAKPRPRGI